MMIEEGISGLSKSAPKISVVIRKRPVSKKESSKNDFDIIDVRSA